MRLRNAKYRSDVHPQQYASQASDQAWIDWALPVMRGDRRVGGADHMWLLGRYVHDSLAGFCLLGAGSREEKAEKLLELVEKKARGEKLNPYEAKVVKNYEEKSRTNRALRAAINDRVDKKRELERADYPHASMRWTDQAKLAKETVFLPEESRVIDQSGVFPVLSDKDAPDLYESWGDKLALQTLTHGRREGGGYFLPRMVFE